MNLTIILNNLKMEDSEEEFESQIGILNDENKKESDIIN